MVHGIHSLKGTESLGILTLTADNISAFEPCFQSIKMEKWPREMTICGRIFPTVQPILDSFTFPGPVVVSSLVENQTKYDRV
ncbi:hypothetical protein SUGI_0688540 [Cryptomeria japonica]|nr:hypothetical protein SUGI_0688540 [Cryptomeria japonica]